MKFKMDPKFHTLNEGIPAGRGGVHIGMDTQHQREGLHIWFTRTCPRVMARIFCDECEYPRSEALYTKDEDQKEVPHRNSSSISIYLSRQDARNLIEEISHRLF